MGKEFSIEKSCCFTGHRDILLCNYGIITETVKTEIKRHYEKGVRRFLAGGAVGFDMLCAKAVLELKDSLDGIFLTLCIPCINHDIKWKGSDKKIFENIRSRADEIIYISEKYNKYCMFKRNRFLVDNSLYCISYCERQSGGSYYTVRYAELLGRHITDLSEKINQAIR